MATYTTAPFLVMIAFLFGFHLNTVLAQSENCNSVDSTSDKCRSADYIVVAGQTVNKGDVKIIQLSGQTEIQWFCGSSQERTAWNTPANQLKISYQSDGTIQWDIYKCSSACESVESTSDKCRSADYITVAGQRVDKGVVNKVIQLPGLQKEIRWYCGSSEERTSWDKPANQLRVNYESDGTIHWNIYKCVHSGAGSVHIDALAALIIICLIILIY